MEIQLNNKGQKLKTWIWNISSFAILPAVLLVNSQVFAQQVVTLVGDPWPPYVDGKLGEDATTGVAVQIVRKIFSLIEGAEVRFPLIPWNRALREVEAGKSDGIVILLKNAERERYMVFSEPLLVGENLVWSVTGNTSPAFEWRDLDDLKGLKLGVTQGYSNGEQLDRSIKNGEVTAMSAPTVEQLFAMLVYGRVDVALANNAVGYSFARKYPVAGIKPAALPISTEVFYIGISKKSAAAKLIPEINHAIRSLHADGYIEKIIRGEKF